jgi:hypothetical protein
MKIIILAAALSVLALLAIALRAMARNAGVPSIDDPAQSTPPVARDAYPKEPMHHLGRR